MLKAKFQEFFNQWNGKPCEVNDPSNLNMCMDLAYAFLDKLEIPRDAIRHLYASEVYTKPNDLTVKFFEMFPNTPNGIPQCGDLVVFKGGVAGHISIAKGEGSTSSFESFDQNYGSTVNKCGLINHSYDNVLGWLRPRVGLIPIPLPGPQINDQTIIHLEGVGDMEVQAIRGEIRDSREAIKNYKWRVSELESLVLAQEAQIGLIKLIKDILYQPNWIWVKLRLLKEIFPK